MTDQESPRALADQASAPDPAAPAPSPSPAATGPGPAPAPDRPASRRGGFFGGILGGLVAGALGYGAGQLWPLAQGAATAPAAELATLRDQLAAATGQTAALGDRLAALEKAAASPSAGPDAKELEALAIRLDGLEAALAQNRPVDPGLVEQLRRDVAQLKLAPPGTIDTAAIEAETTALLDRARAEAASLSGDLRRQAALDRLLAAADSGQPFTNSLAPLGEVPEVLRTLAPTGIPSLTQLRETFPAAARAALEAAIKADMGDSWTERALSFLQSSTGARSLTPRAGDDPDAILSRAEAALAVADLDTTLAELAGLPQIARDAMADWLALAGQRQQALAAIQGLPASIGGP